MLNFRLSAARVTTLDQSITKIMVKHTLKETRIGYWGAIRLKTKTNPKLFTYQFMTMIMQSQRALCNYRRVLVRI